MERKIDWTERASGDVEAIVRYIARRDPQAAGRIGVGIYDRVQILQANPEAGSIRVNADKVSCTQKGCQPVFDLTRTRAGVTNQCAVLASLQDARHL